VGTICAFTPDRRELFVYNPSLNNWTDITSGEVQLKQVVGGRFGLVGITLTNEPVQCSIFAFEPPVF
jgi:hypothetical protein